MPFISTAAPEWVDLMNSCRYDVYHLPAYAELDAAQLEGVALGWYYECRGISALIPFVEREFLSEKDLTSPYGYPGIIVNSSVSDQELIKLLIAFNSEAVDAGYVSSFIRLNPFLNDWNLTNVIKESGIHNFMEQVFPGITFSLNLDVEKAHLGFSLNHKRNLQKLHRSGYSARVNFLNDLPLFIEAYHQTMLRRKARGYYFFSDGYFETLKAIAGDNLILISVLNAEGEFVSGGLFTIFNRLMQYHLGATIDKAVSLSPSKLMIEMAIEVGIKSGAEVIHFGGGIGANNNDGVYRFKQGFAGNRHQFSCLRFIHDYEKYIRLTDQTVTNGISLNDNKFFPLYRSAE